MRNHLSAISFQLSAKTKINEIIVVVLADR